MLAGVPNPLAAQGKDTVAVRVADPEPRQSAEAAGHVARFLVANLGHGSETYHVACIGLGKVRCVGTGVQRITVEPGREAVVEVEYVTGAPGRGLLQLLVRSAATGARAEAEVLVEVVRDRGTP